MSAEAEGSVPGPPLLRVVHGELADEDLAALVAVVAAKASGGEPEKPSVRSQWGHPVLQHRGIHRVGPGQWRASAW